MDSSFASEGVSEGKSRILRSLERWGGEYDPGQSYWAHGLRLLDRLDRQFDVLRYTQRDQLDSVRGRIETMTPREAAFVSGLLTECIGVAAAEGEGDA